MSELTGFEVHALKSERIVTDKKEIKEILDKISYNGFYTSYITKLIINADSIQARTLSGKRLTIKT